MRVNYLPLGMLVLSVAPLGAQTVFAAPEPPDLPMLMALRAGGAGGQSFLGVGVAEIDAARAKDLKLKEVYGIEITRMEEDSAAAKAGLKVADVVLGYNGQRVEGNEQFIRLVRETPPGREVKLLISRNGIPQTIPVVMGSHKTVSVNRETWLNMPEIPMPEIPRVFATWSSSMLGIEAEALTHQLAEFFGAKDGVLVRAVVKDSAAEKAGIKAGDVIVKIDQTSVANPSEVTSAVRAARAKKTFPVELVRDKHETTVNVTMEGDQSTSPGVRLHGRSVKM
jgi:serine protease Do